GAPIKASDIAGNPGLKVLHEKFKINDPLKQPLKLRVKNAIDLSFAKHKGQSLEEMIVHLQKDKIQVVLRQNEEGKIYGMTYIDHQNKVVFNGSDLGKQYSANEIQERIRQQQLEKMKQVLKDEPTLKHKPIPKQPSETFIEQPPKQNFDTGLQFDGLTDIMNALTKSEYEGYVPGELKRKQKQKRKRKRI
ncbi:MAG TPA: hypothetical protein VK588_04070, partial [Chitinophagaceae bacterium]|nr:hypothetical protein [Chitinophagaceae bacterium]